MRSRKKLLNYDIIDTCATYASLAGNVRGRWLRHKRAVLPAVFVCLSNINFLNKPGIKSTGKLCFFPPNPIDRTP